MPTAPDCCSFRIRARTRRNFGSGGVIPATLFSWFFKPFIEATVANSTASAGQPDWMVKNTDSGGSGVIRLLMKRFPVSGVYVIVGRSVYRAAPPTVAVLPPATGTSGKLPAAVTDVSSE